MSDRTTYIDRFVNFYCVEVMDVAATKLLVQCGFYDEAHIENVKAISAFDVVEDRKLRGYVYPMMELLEEEVVNSLTAFKDDNAQTGRYVCSILSKLEHLTYYFYPKDDVDKDALFLRSVIQVAMQEPSKLGVHIPAFLVDRVNQNLDFKVTNGLLKPENRAREYKLWLKTIEHALDGHFNKDAIATMRQLKNGLHTIGVIIQSALMENGSKMDLFKYQAASRVTIAEDITIADIARVRSWTREYCRTISHGYTNIYELDMMGQKIPMESQAGHTKWPQLKVLEDAVNELFYQVSQGESRQRVNWELLEGSNLISFQREVAELSKETPEQYNQALLFAVDRILNKYIFCMKLEKHYDERTKDGIICIQAENLLTKYFAVICRQCITMEPQNCAFKLVSDLGISLNTSWSYLYGQAVKMSEDLSENLRNRLQVNQCNKCQVRGCMGRFSDVLGIVDYVGPHCDSLLFQDSPASHTTEEEHPAITEARAAGLLDSQNKILKTRADFVRFCVKKDYFHNWGRNEFRAISNVLIDRKGNPISEDQLAQSYSDIIGKTKKGA